MGGVGDFGLVISRIGFLVFALKMSGFRFWCLLQFSVYSIVSIRFSVFGDKEIGFSVLVICLASS